MFGLQSTVRRDMGVAEALWEWLIIECFVREHLRRCAFPVIRLLERRNIFPVETRALGRVLWLMLFKVGWFIP